MLKRRTTTLTALTVAVAGLATPLLLNAPAHAGTKQTIQITDTRLIPAEQGSATTSLAECPSAVSVDQRFNLGGGKPHGVFPGIRDFQCANGGLVIRMNASFTDSGSRGSWSIVDSYGDLAGTSGSGKLLGEPTSGGIIDHYDGTITRR